MIGLMSMNPKKVDDKCDKFYSSLLPMIDTYFPTKSTKVHDQDKPWMTPAIKSLIHERQTAFANKDNARWHQLKNKVKRQIESAKADYYVNRVQKLKKSNPPQWYKHIKCMTSGQTKSPSVSIPGL